MRKHVESKNKVKTIFFLASRQRLTNRSKEFVHEKQLIGRKENDQSYQNKIILLRSLTTKKLKLPYIPEKPLFTYKKPQPAFRLVSGNNPLSPTALLPPPYLTALGLIGPSKKDNI
jgi:hypothetical protein